MKNLDQYNKDFFVCILKIAHFITCYFVVGFYIESNKYVDNYIMDK